MTLYDSRYSFSQHCAIGESNSDCVEEEEEEQEEQQAALLRGMRITNGLYSCCCRCFHPPSGPPPVLCRVPGPRKAGRGGDIPVAARTRLWESSFLAAPSAAAQPNGMGIGELELRDSA